MGNFVKKKKKKEQRELTTKQYLEIRDLQSYTQHETNVFSYSNQGCQFPCIHMYHGSSAPLIFIKISIGVHIMNSTKKKKLMKSKEVKNIYIVHI